MDKEYLRRELEAGRDELRAKIVQFRDMRKEPATSAGCVRMARLLKSLETVDQSYTVETEFYFLGLAEYVFRRLLLGGATGGADDLPLPEHLRALREHGEDIWAHYKKGQSKATYLLLAVMFAWASGDGARALAEHKKFTDFDQSFSGPPEQEFSRLMKKCLAEGKMEEARQLFAGCMDRLQNDQLEALLEILAGSKKRALEIIEVMEEEDIDRLAQAAQGAKQGNKKEKETYTDLSDAEFFIGRGAISYDAGDYARSLENYDQALRLDPENAMAYYERALTYEAMDQSGQALADFDRALALEPENAEYYANRGIFHEAHGSPEAALADFNRALELDPTQGNAYMSRGIMKSDSGDKTGALEDFNSAERLLPQNPRVYYNRAVVRIDLEDKQGAIEDLTAAIEKKSDYGAAYLMRGLLRMMLRQRQAALSDLRQGCELDPADPSANEVMKVYGKYFKQAPGKSENTLHWGYLALILLMAGVLLALIFILQ
ncbi:tetratricopeptide repeat protein [candidate division FCPU426 bacterium]|nr:tetratricopeptide repeat protein [candidate division FCPU426 bacterium]